MPAELARRFRIGEVPPLAEGFTDRPDTAAALADVPVPGSAVALVPNPAAAESLPNWSGAEEIPSAASVTWILCLERAESLLAGPPIRLMLVFPALLDGHGVPGVVFGAPSLLAYLGGNPTGPTATGFSAADPRHVWDVLLVLERVGLIGINRDVTPPTVLMSSPLQAAIKLAASAELREPAARAAASTLLEVWPAEEPQPWAAASLRANAASLQDSAADALWAEGCHPLLLRAGHSLDQARLVVPAVDFWSDLAARCDAKLTSGHPDTLAVAAQLAAAYLAAGNAAEAVKWHQRVLADRTRELAAGHPGIVAARVSLARALIMAGQPADAVTVMLRAVAEYEQSRGGGHPETLGARDELATAYQAAGDYAAAGQLLARSLADRERLQGPRDPQTMATRDRLAAACLAEGKGKDAISHYKRVLSDREKELGRAHLDTIATAASLAAAYEAVGRMPAAMQLAERCCADSERILGPNHADTLVRRVNLAHLHYRVGRVGDAVALLHDTAVRCERVLPYGDPLTDRPPEPGEHGGGLMPSPWRAVQTGIFLPFITICPNRPLLSRTWPSVAPKAAVRDLPLPANTRAPAAG